MDRIERRFQFERLPTEKIRNNLEHFGTEIGAIIYAVGKNKGHRLQWSVPLLICGYAALQCDFRKVGGVWRTLARNGE